MNGMTERTALLLGEDGVERLKKAHVLLFGLGGVGSYVAEALARAGVGNLTLVDDDTVSESNLNRQLVALHSTLGQNKAQVAAARIRDINPDCNVTVAPVFYMPATAHELPFDGPVHYDYIVDAIDTVTAKLEIIRQATEQKQDVVRLHTGDPCLYGAIREQMDALDADGICYDDTPGVSSFCGAAAALNAEYTLPTVSQTVIITRMEGRTPVPERERLASLAAHGATMVIFLSIGLIDKVQTALLQGAYSPDTPAAVVYKASWPEQKVVRCTVGTLAGSTRANGITKTALIVVGEFLGTRYERSKLYDPTFTTEFRKGADQ